MEVRSNHRKVVIFFEDRKQTVITVMKKKRGYKIAINRVGYDKTRVLEDST